MNARSSLLVACLSMALFAPSASFAAKEDAVKTGRPVFAGKTAVGYPAYDKPIPLKESIEALMRNNHSLKALQENRTAVGHEIDHAKAGWGPRLDLTARGGFGKLSNSTTRSYGYDSVSPHYTTSLIATQPLWDGGLTRGKVREAEATYRSLDHRVMDNANTLALDAVIAHIEVLLHRHNFELAEQNVARHEEILSKAEERESFGVDTMADVSQAQSRLARAKSTLTEARATMLIGEETYTRLTRLSASSLAPVVMPAGMYANAEEVLKEAQKFNPKVSAYLEDINAASARKEQSASAYQPNIAIEAGPSYSNRDNERELETFEFDVAAVVRWNLFNSGADVAANKASAARIRQARQGLYDYMDELKLIVNESWAEYISALEQEKFYREALEFNQITRDAYQEQFVLGERSLLDVLDAENELYNSSTQAATAHSNALIAAYRMKALTNALIPSFNISTEILKYTAHDHEPLDHVTLP